MCLSEDLPGIIKSWMRTSSRVLGAYIFFLSSSFVLIIHREMRERERPWGEGLHNRIRVFFLSFSFKKKKRRAIKESARCVLMSARSKRQKVKEEEEERKKQVCDRTGPSSSTFS